MKRQNTQIALLTSRSVTWAAIVTDTALSAAKISAGLAFASQTILADGLHSASDLATDIAVLAGLRVAAKPADRGHLYGHRRATTLVAVIIGVTLLAAGGWIFFNAIFALRGPPKAIRATVPFWIAVAGIPIKEALYQITRHVGNRESDISLLANAWHHRTDAFSSIAAAVGLAGVLIGGPDWQMLDSLTALLLSAFLVVLAVRILLSSASELMDRAPSDHILTVIEKAIRKTEGVKSYHAFRARSVGRKVEMDVHVQVTPFLTVRQGHDIASQVERSIRQADPNVIEVVVHIEPAAH